MKILIIGHARHGKDTLAEFLFSNYGLTYSSSSLAASEIFIYEKLKDKYDYSTPEECFEDRVNHRAEWYDLIVEYNSKNKSRLASEILTSSNMYVGMRDSEEIEACKEEGLFDFVIGVFDPRKPLEPKDSFNIDLWKESDFIIPNASTLEDFENKTIHLFDKLIKLNKPINLRTYEGRL